VKTYDGTSERSPNIACCDSNRAYRQQTELSIEFLLVARRIEDLTDADCVVDLQPWLLVTFLIHGNGTATQRYAKEGSTTEQSWALPEKIDADKR
jgi:hypothetical protein